MSLHMYICVFKKVNCYIKYQNNNKLQNSVRMLNKISPRSKLNKLSGESDEIILDRICNIPENGINFKNVENVWQIHVSVYFVDGINIPLVKNNTRPQYNLHIFTLYSQCSCFININTCTILELYMFHK